MEMKSFSFQRIENLKGTRGPLVRGGVGQVVEDLGGVRVVPGGPGRSQEGGEHSRVITGLLLLLMMMVVVLGVVVAYEWVSWSFWEYGDDDDDDDDDNDDGKLNSNTIIN